MLLYLSESKIYNLYNEARLKNKRSTFSLSTLKVALRVVEGEVKKEEADALAELNKILRWKNVKKITKATISSDLEAGILYECDGTMHWKKTRPTNTGTIITFEFYTNPNSKLNFVLDIDNPTFSELLLTCSMKNFAFMDFADQNRLEPNSLGDILISADISLEVRAIFELFIIDREKGSLLGAPVIIYTDKTK